MSLKLKHNIISFPELGLNYWGIPKCYNTSVKYSLFKAIGVDGDPSGHAKWVHNTGIDRYITPADALSNGMTSFSAVRHPIKRFISLYKDLGVTRGNGLSVSEFIDRNIRGKTDDCNVHFRSMS